MSSPIKESDDFFEYFFPMPKKFIFHLFTKGIGHDILIEYKLTEFKEQAAARAENGKEIRMSKATAKKTKSSAMQLTVRIVAGVLAVLMIVTMFAGLLF